MLQQDAIWIWIWIGNWQTPKLGYPPMERVPWWVIGFLVTILTVIIPTEHDVWARESSVTHKSAITDNAMEENHVIDWDKAKVVDREAQRQTRWIKEALWIRKTPMCMNRDAVYYQLSHTWDQVISRSRAPSSCKQSRCDQDVRRTSKHCH